MLIYSLDYVLLSMGLAMHLWAGVEDALFLLFSSILRSPSETMDSIVFYSCPSFESKRVLTDRLSQKVLTSEDHKRWESINKRLIDESSFRGKIAHYGIDHEVQNNNAILAALLKDKAPPDPILGPPHLRRSKKNKISVGKKGQLTTDSKDILKHCNSFSLLSDDIKSLSQSVKLSHIHLSPTPANSLSSFLHYPGTQEE